MKTIYFLLLNAALLSFSYAQNTVTIGNGTGTQGAPVSRFFRYHTSEMIYLQSEINQAGFIEKVAFNKQSGTNNNPIEQVEIYMRHTSEATLMSGTSSTVGYTLVYAGNFTNDAATGWMEVNLDTPFSFNNEDNLQILIIKGNQAPLTSAQFPRYTFTTSSGTRIRSYNDDSVPWSDTRNMTASTSLPNIQMYMTPSCEPTFATFNETSCGVFEFNGIEYMLSGTFTQTLVNAAGCDSTITLNLTVIEIDTDIIISGVTMNAAIQSNATYQWINCATNQDIQGANSSVFMPLTNGSYKVRISIGDCSEESECVAFNVLSLDKSSLELIRIFPNPVADVLQIESPLTETKMSLVDLSGKTVIPSQWLDLGLHQISLATLAPGAYFIILENEGKTVHKRIIKN